MPPSRRLFLRHIDDPPELTDRRETEHSRNPRESLAQKILHDIDSLVDEHGSLDPYVGGISEDASKLMRDGLNQIAMAHERNEAPADFVGLTPCVRRRSTLVDVPLEVEEQHNSAQRAHRHHYDPRAPDSELNEGSAGRDTCPASRGGGRQKGEPQGAFESIYRHTTKEDAEREQKGHHQSAELSLDDLYLDDGARPGGTHLIRRSTFGRPIRVTVRPQAQEEEHHSTLSSADPTTRLRSGARTASQYSLGPSPNHTRSHSSDLAAHAEAHRPGAASGPIYQPHTPGSADSQSLYQSTPRSLVRAAKSRLFFPSSFPSPEIFGMRRCSPSTSTPHRAGSQGKQNVESYFDFKDAPPPLPPLDHPAFREARLAGGSLMKNGANASDFRGRHATNSLPSLKQAQTESPRSRSSTRQDRENAYGRQRSKSTVGPQRQQHSRDETRPSGSFHFKGKSHVRNQSLGKSSIASCSSRRSSAEYSAKQASSIGHETNDLERCWEVDVSRAIISLSLEKEVQRTPARKSTTASRYKSQAKQNEASVACHSSSGNTSALGKARGDNREPGGELWLGSPFFLQDPSSDNSKKRLRTDARAAHTHSNQITQAILPERSTHSRLSDMTDAQGSPSAGAARRKELSLGASSRRSAVSPSPSGSKSRRGGTAISMPSLSEAAPQKLNTNQEMGSIQGSSTLSPPVLSVTGATPTPSPISPVRRTHHKSTPTMPTRRSALKTPSTPPVMEKSYSTGSGKRKADDADVGGDKTPPKDSREPRATFAPEPRTHRASAVSGTSTHAPSSFNRSKRVRLTEHSEGRGSQRSISRAGNLPQVEDNSPNAKSTGSWSSRGSHRMSSTSHSQGPPPARSASHMSHHSQQRPPSRHSLSQASIPLSALISPNVASVSRVGTFHMRDPRKPNPLQSTPWSLSLPSQVDSEESRWARKGWVERGGSPLHAWLFFIGFVVFPIWWFAAIFVPVPRTRHLSADSEKGVILDDPQVEHDAKSWRTRCRVMAGVSVFTYVPFIVLVAIYAR